MKIEFQDKVDIHPKNKRMEKDLLSEYLQTLTEKERQGYEIAKSHLGLSFDLSKSLGFLEWKKRREPKKES